MKSFCLNIIRDFFNDNFRYHKREDKSSKPRIEFIDLAKGVCILLVVIVHFDYTDGAPALQALRMPLYFILSGLFYKDYESIIGFVIKKTNRILIPFCFFLLIALLLFINSGGSLSQVYEEATRPFFEPTMINSPIWFLLGLFWTNIIYRIICSFSTRLSIKASIVAASGVVGYYLYKNDIYLPLYLSSAFTALPFFFIGCVLRKVPLLYHSANDKKYLLLGIFLLLGAVTYCYFYGTPHIDIRTNEYSGSVIEIFSVSVSTVVGFLLLCKAVKWLPVVSYLGRYSIIVLGLHRLVKLHVGFPFKFFNVSLSNFESLLLTILICWMAIPICRHLFPYFTAQAELLSYEKVKKAIKWPIGIVRNM